MCPAHLAHEDTKLIWKDIICTLLSAVRFTVAAKLKELARTWFEEAALASWREHDDWI